MKRVTSLLLSFVFLICTFSFFAFGSAEASSYITASKTPTANGKLLFSKKLGTGYKNAPTAPIVVGDTLIVASGTKLYKLNAQDGNEISSTVMQGTLSFSAACPTYADSKLFVQLDGGKIQAFDFKTMKSLWVYTDSLGGQSLSPITYADGYIYTGFWNGEESDANYVCISTKDEDTKNETEAKKAKWTYKHKGGFYWAGSALEKDFVIVGSDDGLSGYTGKSSILCLNKENGKLVSSLSTNGDIRSSVTYNERLKSYFVSSKSGYVYKFSFNNSSGVLSSLKSFKAAGSVTSSPVCHNGRLYIGCQNEAKGFFYVIDAATMKEIYKAETPGYPQATALIGTGYEDSGKIYIYMTYNAKPGGIVVFEDSINQNKPLQNELFIPDESMSQFCTSPITAGNDGTLYYKNDSGNIFAVTKNTSSFFSVYKLMILNILSFIRKALGLI